MADLSSLPISYVLLFLNIVRERGIDPEILIRRMGLSLEDLSSPDQLISGHQIESALLQVYELTGDQGLGLEYGLRSGPMLHGMLGYALVSASSVTELAQLAVRFTKVRQDNFTLSLRQEDGVGILEATDARDMGSLRRFIYESSLVGYAYCITVLLAEKKVPCEIWFDWAEPEYHADFCSRLPVINYDMPAIQLRYPLALADQRPVMADPLALRDAVKQCERIDVLKQSGSGKLVIWVQAFIETRQRGYPDLETTANSLNISASTLKRRLREEGVSYQKILDDIRYRDALKMLANPELTVGRISKLLGYKAPPSFTRAFKSWSGKKPSEARKDLSCGE